jgi:hypothetical protein
LEDRRGGDDAVQWKGVGSMRDAYELTRDGPYVRVVIPDVLPPDWDALAREVSDEVEDGATQFMLLAAGAATMDTHGERLTALVTRLEAEGVTAVVVTQEEVLSGTSVLV